MLITHDMLAGSKMFVQLTADSKKEAQLLLAIRKMQKLYLNAGQRSYRSTITKLINSNSIIDVRDDETQEPVNCKMDNIDIVNLGGLTNSLKLLSLLALCIH